MDVILPYVAWITLLAYLMDFALARLSRRGPSPGPMSRSGADERASRSATSGSSMATRSCSSGSISTSPTGAFLSVVGPSGAGKSTFLRLILGQERPTRGAILHRRRAAARRAGPRPRRRLPALFGVPASDRARQCAARLRVRAEPVSLPPDRRRAARGDRGERQPDRGGRARRRIATNIRAPSPAACSSASPSPRRSRASRRCCCSTSRSARSIPARARRCTR